MDFLWKGQKPRYTLHALHLVISDWRAEGTKGVALDGNQITRHREVQIVQLVVSLYCTIKFIY
jgi:hypothetical protein